MYISCLFIFESDHLFKIENEQSQVHGNVWITSLGTEWRNGTANSESVLESQVLLNFELTLLAAQVRSAIRVAHQSCK